ncbi:MAG: SWIM zinc finger family protein [Magnetococcales bacterium]|nr:SWIM zinc finger family protein [Magnetococcales bacterium]
MARRWQREWFRKSVPLTAIGGIRAASKGTEFGKNWWAKRWNETLERFSLGSRLVRGRNYARNGQVLSIDVGPGEVLSTVQGSRHQPYDVMIRLRRLSTEDWARLTRTLSGQARFAARLMAGEMPEEIEEVFHALGLSLFPDDPRDLMTKCSCPDWSNPCKHVAAVFYLLGEAFDADPFLIFHIRGMEREAFLRQLGGTRATHPTEETPPAYPPTPLPTAIDPFWRGKPVSGDLFGEATLPPVHAALLKRLGSLPFWRGKVPLLEEFEPVYPYAAVLGLSLLAGAWCEEMSITKKENPHGENHPRQEKKHSTAKKSTPRRKN